MPVQRIARNGLSNKSLTVESQWLAESLKNLDRNVGGQPAAEKPGLCRSANECSQLRRLAWHLHAIPVEHPFDEPHRTEVAEFDR